MLNFLENSSVVFSLPSVYTILYSRSINIYNSGDNQNQLINTVLKRYQGGR